MSIPILLKSPSYNIVVMETVVLTASQKYTAWMYTPTKTRSESCLNTSILGWPSHRRITSKPSKRHSSLVKPPVSLPTSPMNHVCEMKCIQTGSYISMGRLTWTLFSGWKANFRVSFKRSSRTRPRRMWNSYLSGFKYCCICMTTSFNDTGL